MWLENVEVFVNSSSSADEHKSSKVRKSDGADDFQSPDLFARRRTASIRWRSDDVVKSRQARQNNRIDLILIMNANIISERKLLHK